MAIKLAVEVTRCGQCALCSPDKTKCELTDLPINPDVDFCSKAQINPIRCAFCGQILVNGSCIQQFEGVWRQMCLHCTPVAETCRFCDKAQFCAFESDPNPLPKQVPVQVQQGNMIMQTVIRNPERVKEICAKSCPCYSQDLDCIRLATQKCRNWHHTFPEGV